MSVSAPLYLYSKELGERRFVLCNDLDKLDQN